MVSPFALLIGSRNRTVQSFMPESFGEPQTTTPSDVPNSRADNAVPVRPYDGISSNAGLTPSPMVIDALSYSWTVADPSICNAPTLIFVFAATPYQFPLTGPNLNGFDALAPKKLVFPASTMFVNPLSAS